MHARRSQRHHQLHELRPLCSDLQRRWRLGSTVLPAATWRVCPRLRGASVMRRGRDPDRHVCTELRVDVERVSTFDLHAQPNGEATMRRVRDAIAHLSGFGRRLPMVAFLELHGRKIMHTGSTRSRVMRSLRDAFARLQRAMQLGKLGQLPK